MGSLGVEPRVPAGILVFPVGSRELKVSSGKQGWARWPARTSLVVRSRGITALRYSQSQLVTGQET